MKEKVRVKGDHLKSKRYKLPNKIDTNPADKRQLKYMKSLGLTIPPDLSRSDAEALINRELDDDCGASGDLKCYAKAKEILYSEYIGSKQLYNLLFDNLCKEDKTAFFCFCVYTFYHKGESENLLSHEKRELFEAFGREYENHFYFQTSLEEYTGEECMAFGKSTRTLEDGRTEVIYGGSIYGEAYKLAYAYLEKHLS